MKLAASTLTALAVALVAALPGCVRMAPIYELDAVPVNAPSLQPLSAEQVRVAIMKGGMSLGWRFADTGPGELEGTLTLREHIAVVQIPYSGAGYAIRHKRSTNLNEGGGMIHSNYNGWIQNLDRAIRTQVERL